MNLTTKNQVMDYLQWSSEEYESRMYLAMFKWCEKHGKFPSLIQQLLANSQINKWFLQQYSKYEQQFIKIAELDPNNLKRLEGHYKACTAEIQDVYPKPLLEQIKSNPIFSQTYLINVPQYHAN